MSVLAFSTCGTDVANTDLVTVSPAVACVFPGWGCGFSVVGATFASSYAASPSGEVGDDGKDTGDLGSACRKGIREGCVGYDKSLDVVVFLDGGFC